MNSRSDSPTPNPDQQLVLGMLHENAKPGSAAGNPLANDMNLRVESASSGQVRLSFGIDRRFTQGAGAVQGGILTAMLDFAMVFAGFTVVEESTALATVSLSVNFMRAAREGAFTALGRVDKHSRKLVFAAAELLGSDGAVVATASCVLSAQAR